ncbi:hypothetical protein T06_3639 [Trichinella sp. T6]|nr:hypothetical protein T06_3639 [Trichinella sp. T6]
MVWKFIKSTWARDIKFVLTSGLTNRLFGSFLALFLWHSSPNVRNKWQASCVTFADLFCASQNVFFSTMTNLLMSIIDKASIFISICNERLKKTVLKSVN